MPFSNQIALITGGSSGIGYALGRLLAANGAHVWLLARDQNRLAEALAGIEENRRSSSQRCGTLSADVTDPDQAANAIDQLIQKIGVPDLVINSAGVAHPGRFYELDLKIFHWMMDVNYFGIVNILKAVVPSMINRGSGHIVNISSSAGFIGVYGYSAYGASKYAVRGFSDVLRAELKPLGIKVSTVFPPDTETPQLAYEDQFKPAETKALSGSVSPMSAEDVARTILQGVERGKYVILPGSDNKMLFKLAGLLGKGVYPLMDFMIARAQKKDAQDTDISK